MRAEISILSCVWVLGAATVVAAPQSARIRAEAPVADWRSESDAYQRLRRQAGIKGQPIELAPTAVERVFDEPTEPLGPDSTAWPSARVSLPDALESLAASVRPESPGIEPPSANASARIRAQRIYAAGVAKLIDGHSAEAARDLEAAARLDPGAAHPWIKLGEAQAQMGQGSAALLSYKKGIDLGANDPLALALLGFHARQMGKHEDAARYLAACLRSRPRLADPLLENVALIEIAAPLRKSGYLRASMTALERGLDLPERLSGRTRFRDEAMQIAARSGDLWGEVGEIAALLGESTEAEAALERASSLPSQGAHGLLSRRAELALREGDGARAALLILDDLAERSPLVTGGHRRLLRAIGEEPEIGRLTAGALADHAVSPPAARSDAVLASIVVARAMLMEESEATSLLLEHLHTAPTDREATATLMSLQAGDEERFARAVKLVAGSPSAAGLAAEQLLAWCVSPMELLEHLGGGGAEALLKSHLLRLLDRPGDAIESARTGFAAADSQSVELRRALGLALGFAAASDGRWDLVDEATGLLAEDDHSHRASILRAAQRYQAAYAELLRLEPTTMDAEGLLRLSELALASGNPAEAERFAVRAFERDPFRESAYEGLLSLYQPGSPVADAERLGMVLAQLRERIPASRMLRWVVAQEQAQRGLVESAERQLLSIENEAARPEAIYALLTRLWEQRAALGETEHLARVEAWLADRVVAAPVSAEAIAARGAVLGLLGRHAEAEALLRSQIENRPLGVLKRALENAIRRAGDAERAERLELSRLSTAPRGIDGSLEHAESLARAGQFDQAVERLVEAMPQGARLTTPQAVRVRRVLGELVVATDRRENRLSPVVASRAFEHARRSGIQLAWQLQHAAWRLAVLNETITDDELGRMTTELVESVESIEVARSLNRLYRGEDPPISPTLDDARAELAYIVANVLASSDRQQAAFDAFRTALRFNPDHAGAANDLGYTLLTLEQNLDEAERLIAHAHELEPDDANIADSLGWLRYKTGVIEDQRGEDGGVIEGAVTLLRRAVTLPDGESSPTIHDHLGDALWRSGKREAARAAWVEAHRLLIGRISTLRDGGDSPLRRRYTEEHRAVGAKVDALLAGEEPVPEPVFGEADR